MPTPKSAAAAKKAAAATSETDTATVKQVDFRGITFTLPAQMPGSILWDMSDLENPQESLPAVMRLLESLLGRDQYMQARAKVIEDNVSFEEVEEVITGLLESVMDEYGLNLGKPPASPAS